MSPVVYFTDVRRDMDEFFKLQGMIRELNRKHREKAATLAAALPPNNSPSTNSRSDGLLPNKSPTSAGRSGRSTADTFTLRPSATYTSARHPTHRPSSHSIS